MDWLYQALLDKCGKKRLLQLGAAVLIGATVVAMHVGHSAHSGFTGTGVLLVIALGGVMGGIAGGILIACDVMRERFAQGKPPLLPDWCMVGVILGCVLLFIVLFIWVVDLFQHK